MQLFEELTQKLKNLSSHTLVLMGLGVAVVLAAGGLALWLSANSPTHQAHQANQVNQKTHTVTGSANFESNGLKPMPQAVNEAMQNAAGEKPTQLPTLEVLETPKYVANAEAGVTVLEKRPKIAIVIDDVGVHKAHSREADRVLPPEVTFSFLPYGGATMELARKARKEHREVMIHLPMEPMPRLEEPPIDPGPNALYIDLSPEEIRKRTHINLAELKDMSVGVNNHMGSRFTSYKEGMEEVLKIVDDEGLFFMDSLTTNESAVEDAAKAVAPNMPLLKRDVFLDHYITEEALNKALLRLEDEAREKGHAIAIGHPHSRTLKVLQDWLPTLPYKGIDLVPITHMLADESETFTPTPPALPKGMPIEEAKAKLKTEESSENVQNAKIIEDDQPHAQQKEAAPAWHGLNPNDENVK